VNSVCTVNFAFWRELAGGDDGSARELVALFLGTTSEQISAVISGLAAGNAGEVARAAHTAAGSSSTCGADALALLFRQLEREASDQRFDALSHTVPLIVEAFDGVHARLARMLAASTSASLEERT
jgi:HPt (histidine-containing phosphotransfer) domain-containing protein